MNVTSLAFLESVESKAREVLPPVPFAGAEWKFQRFVAFHSQSGSLQALVQAAGGEPQLVGVVQVRKVADSQGSFLRGWMQTERMQQPHPFVLHTSTSADLAGVADSVAESWTRELLKAIAGPQAAIGQPGGAALPGPDEDPASP